MTPVHTRKASGQEYRYYVSSRLQQGARASDLDSDTIRRAPAVELEALVLGRLRTLHGHPEAAWSELGPLLRRVELHPECVVILTAAPGGREAHRRLIAGEQLEHDSSGDWRVRVPARFQPRGGRSWLVQPNGGYPAQRRPRINPLIVDALRRAHAACATHDLRPARDGSLTDARSPDDFRTRKLVRLALLAPDIQADLLAGRQPPGLTLQRLMDDELPLAWADQRIALGWPPAGD